MNEMLSDFCTWVSDMKENPEIIGFELADMGGKIGRGVAALVGGTVEAVGAVGAAAVDITGERSSEGAFGESEVESVLESVFKMQVVWIPMGRA